MNSFETRKWQINSQIDTSVDDLPECRSISPNGALPIIPPPEYIHAQSALRPGRGAASPSTRNHTSLDYNPGIVPPNNYRPNFHHPVRTYSPTFNANNATNKQPSPKPQSQFTSLQSRKEEGPRTSNRYLLDDDEFAFMAHVILQQHQRLSEAEENQGCPSFTVENLWYLITGERDSNPTGVTFTEKEIDDFQVALKQRMKHLPYRPRPKEDPLIRLTREVAQTVAQWGFPKPRDEKSTSQRPTVDQRDDEIPLNRRDDGVGKIASTADYRPESVPIITDDIRSTSKSPFVPYDKMHHAVDTPYLSEEQDVRNAEFVSERYLGEVLPDRSEPREHVVAPRVFEVESIKPTKLPPTPETKYYEVVGDYLMPIKTSNDRNSAVDTPMPAPIGEAQIDRSFETETVVARETFLWSPAQNLPAPSSKQVTGGGSSRAKQKIKDEIQRVTAMLNLTTNDDVRKSCLARLARLRSDFLAANDSNAKGEQTAPRQESIELEPPKQDKPPVLDHTEEMKARPDPLEPHSGDDRYHVEEMKPRHGNVAEINTEERNQERWKDSLFDCLKYGPLHPTVVNGVLCPIIALGQVMTRLRLNWIGRAGSRNHPKESFRVALFLSMAVVAVDGVWYYLPRIQFLDLSLQLFNLVIFVYFCANVWRTRCHVRKRFSIPVSGSRTFLEDAVSSFACPCFSIMQLSRQTADYDSYNAQLCTSNGLPLNVPIYIPPSPEHSALSSLTTRYEC